MQDLRDQALKDPPPMECRVVPTGIDQLDDILGGGLPRGDALCLYHIPPTESWTFLSIAMKTAQGDGLRVFWIGPHEPQTERWATHGIDIGKVMVLVCTDLTKLRRCAEIAEIDEADLLIIEGFSTMANPNSETRLDLLHTWGEQQRVLYDLTRRRKLRGMSIIISRAVGQKYASRTVTYSAYDNYALFIDDDSKDHFQFRLMSHRSHIPSIEIRCKLPI